MFRLRKGEPRIFNVPICLWLMFLALPVLLNGCAGMYFRDAGEAPSEKPRFELGDWAVQDYWTCVVFNGTKIGFTHLTLTPSKEEPGLFDIRSEASLRFRFLTFDKRVTLTSFDRVRPDGSLKSFAYDYDLDGNRMKVSGALDHGKLEVKTETRDQTHFKSTVVEGALFPSCITYLYPVLYGLGIGKTHEYMVYDGQTRSVSPIEQKVLAFEESDLFTGKAYKIKTSLRGQNVTAWIDNKGVPLLEISMKGVLIAGIESEDVAKRYLAKAALNKDEILLDFSLVKTQGNIPEPRRLTYLEVLLKGFGETMKVPSDDRQQCRHMGEDLVCHIDSSRRGTPESSPDPGSENGPAPYLEHSIAIPSQNRLIRETAESITAGVDSPLRRMRLLVDWIGVNIRQEPVDVFSALDVLEGKKAECQGHAILYAALARSLHIPTRIVNGIVYSEAHQGFLYHTWAESLDEEGWIAVDATFGQVPADATHIKFIEGETISDLLPIVNVIGRLKAKVIKVRGIPGDQQESSDTVELFMNGEKAEELSGKD